MRGYFFKDGSNFIGGQPLEMAVFELMVGSGDAVTCYAFYLVFLVLNFCSTVMTVVIYIT
jgi:hypothetical protein